MGSGRRMSDLVIRSAAVYDGTGAEPATADVAVAGERSLVRTQEGCASSLLDTAA